ncbi:hypothetical protein RFI_14778 [Reticulomyxa filosa]|uniref:Myotubularin phosphatase domain-containing protein n=1 Tax=Reticulomyxa filosa TaxID=46433 RepID=X6N826_RETFI|nr:hypothetical protein RFI_14778 [Reticulomyxa filosa]|eukprot:ETO22420.1 hypothetical protein RFI_14778 [Reticulomyxa filosa]
MKTKTEKDNDSCLSSSVYDEGWLVYNPWEEFTRQRVPWSDSTCLGMGMDKKETNDKDKDKEKEKDKDKDKNKDQWWRMMDVNKDWSYCPTYPSHFVMPAQMTSKDVQEIKLFRANGRVPILAYYHFQTDASILRSSQPMTGVGLSMGLFSTLETRNKADERLLQLANVKYIVDARSKYYAFFNKAKGGGYENVDFYPGTHVF